MGTANRPPSINFRDEGTGPSSASAGGAAETASTWFRTRSRVWVGSCLATIVVAAILMRFLTLREIPYPPSSDAAGDLTWMHVYLGRALPGYTLEQAAPPIYILLVVLPFTGVLGTFLGIQALMATMPALLAVPMYFLMRWAKLGTLPSVVAAAAIAFSPVTSNMVTWNSGFNVTGMIFLTAFFALWIRSSSDSSWRSLALTGFALSLVAGTHPLTFFYGIVTVLIYLVLVLVSRSRTLRPHVRPTLAILGFAALFSLPYAPLYYFAYTGLTNVGVASSSSAVNTVWTALSQTLSFPWAGSTHLPPLIWSGLFLLPLMIASACAIVFIWADQRDWLLGTVCISQVLSVVIIGPLDAANSDRALYFLPIAIIPLTVAWATRFSRSAPFREWISLLRSRLRLPRFGRLRRMARPIAVIALSLAFVSTTAYISQTQMRTAESFYLMLDDHRVAALDWLKDSTPSNASVFDGANLQAWIPGLAERASYAPGSLSADITSQSYARTFDANLIELGTGVIGNGYLYVGSNLPGAYSSPGIYLRTPSGSDSLWLNEATSTSVTVSSGIGPATVSLANASSIGTTGQVYSNGTASMSSTFRFSTLNLSIEQIVVVRGTTVTVTLSARNGTVAAAHTHWDLPPSGYSFGYPNAPFQRFSGTLAQTLFLSSSRSASVEISGDSLNGTLVTDASGWTRLSANFTHSLRFDVLGLPEVFPNNGPFYTDTIDLSSNLGVHYFVVSENSNYALYERFSALVSSGGGSWTIPFASGDIYVFQSG